MGPIFTFSCADNDFNNEYFNYALIKAFFCKQRKTVNLSLEITQVHFKLI